MNSSSAGMLVVSLTAAHASAASLSRPWLSSALIVLANRKPMSLRRDGGESLLRSAARRTRGP